MNIQFDVIISLYVFEHNIFGSDDGNDYTTILSYLEIGSLIITRYLPVVFVNKIHPYSWANLSKHTGLLWIRYLFHNSKKKKKKKTINESTIN